MYSLRRPLLVSGLLCLASFALFWAAQRAADVSLIDVMVYRAQGEAVLRGDDLYALRATHAELPATYPPFAALLFVPLALVETGTVRTAATAANLLLLVVVAYLSLRLVGLPRRVPRTAVALAVAAVAVWCEPVWTTLRYGQVNLLLAALVLWDLSRRPGHRWAGVGIGVAAGVKLTPALFAVLLAVAGLVEARRRLSDARALGRGEGARSGGAEARTGVRSKGARLPTAVATAVARSWNARLRQAAVATAAFLATAGLAGTVLPAASLRFWTDVLFRAERVGNAEDTANQSLHGVLARALHTGDPGPAATTLSAAVAVAGLAVAVAALRAGARLPQSTAWAATACAVTALLISPVSWSHHWVWCVPVAVLLGAEALRRADDRWQCGLAACTGVFCSYALWWVPHSPDRADRLELRQGAGEMLLSAVYPLAGAAFLGLAAVVAVRAVRRPGPRPGARVARTRGALQAVAKE